MVHTHMILQRFYATLFFNNSTDPCKIRCTRLCTLHRVAIVGNLKQVATAAAAPLPHLL